MQEIIYNCRKGRVEERNGRKMKRKNEKRAIDGSRNRKSAANSFSHKACLLALSRLHRTHASQTLYHSATLPFPYSVCRNTTHQRRPCSLCDLATPLLGCFFCPVALTATLLFCSIAIVSPLPGCVRRLPPLPLWGPGFSHLIFPRLPFSVSCRSPVPQMCPSPYSTLVSFVPPIHK